MRCLDLKTASEDGGGRQLQKRNRETMLGFEIKIVLLCVSLLPFFLSAFLGSVYGLQRPKEEERGEEETPKVGRGLGDLPNPNIRPPPEPGIRVPNVENCNALGVPHSSNQCRRKWSLLLQDYTKIKRWESQSALCDSYWSLGGQRRKEYELLENFDQDLFKAINDVVRLLEEKSGTDRDSDPEAQDDMVEITAELVEKPKKIHVVEQLQESCAEEKPQRSEAEEGTWRIEAGENPEMSYMGIKHMFSVEEKEQIMMARLCEKAEQIHAVVEENFTENADHSAADVKNVEDFRTDFIRRQGDKLVACLGDILSTLNQFSELVQECE
ncbi:hypothetical protein QUC31_020940 [Theobroma cacao]